MKPNGAGFELGDQPLLSAPFISSFDETMFIAPYGCRAVLTAACQGSLLNLFCKRVQYLHVHSLETLATLWKMFIESSATKRFVLRPSLCSVQEAALDDSLEGIFQVASASQVPILDSAGNLAQLEISTRAT